MEKAQELTHRFVLPDKVLKPVSSIVVEIVVNKNQYVEGKEVNGDNNEMRGDFKKPLASFLNLNELKPVKLVVNVLKGENEDIIKKNGDLVETTIRTMFI